MARIKLCHKENTMKFFNKTIFIAFAAICLLAFTEIPSFAQNGNQGMGNGNRNMNGNRNSSNNRNMNGTMNGKGIGLGYGLIQVLVDAGVPLTDEQIALLDEIEPGIENHNERMAILSDEQIEALEAFRAENQTRKGRDRPAWRKDSLPRALY